MQTKVCTKCQRKLPLEQFKKHHRHKDGLQYDCIECQAAYRRLHYMTNKAAYVARAKQRNRKMDKEHRKFITEVKRSAGCLLCNENEPCCLDFHHAKPNKKDFNIGQAMRLSLCVLKKEIDKCVILCSNCHRKVHASLLILPE